MKTNLLTTLGALALAALVAVPGSTASIGSRADHDQNTDTGCTFGGVAATCALYNELWSGAALYSGATGLLAESSGFQAVSYIGVSWLIVNPAACPNGDFVMDAPCGGTGSNAAASAVATDVGTTCGGIGGFFTYTIFDGLGFASGTMDGSTIVGAYSTDFAYIHPTTAITQIYFSTSLDASGSATGCVYDVTPSSLTQTGEIHDNTVYG